MECSTWPRPRKLHMSQTRSHCSSIESSSNNSSRNSLRTPLPKVANEATGNPSVSQPTPPGAANPANRDEIHKINLTAQVNRQAYRQQHRSQKKSSKDDVPPAYAFDADGRTTRPASDLDTHEQVTHHSRTRHQFHTGTEETKTNDRCPSIINSQNTHRIVSACGLTGAVQQGGIGVREVGNAHFDGDNGQQTTASDRFEVRSGVGDPQSSHVKSVLMRHVQTQRITYYSRGLCK